MKHYPKKIKQKPHYLKCLGGLEIADEYCIYAIVNEVNGHRYIGQTKAPLQRRKTHHRELANNRHFNPYLQNACNLYGIGNFVFVILEYVNHWELDEREQYWIDKLNPEYNIVRDLSCWSTDRFNKLPKLIYSIHEEYERPNWHAWVYGGAKNPVLKRR